ncbi:MAG: hypothetical protein GW946_00235 [Candidatus Pacebacteria bacterium]|nr:hypothetical protein [Candidatus Paceibacterota bacterium]PIR60246.1 MAG: hypothetical protein COU67_02890 [Candidatus Pacebacteria bacterium CG10_big_fil_rev_8_21_14_0_10_44_54]
MSEKSEQMIKEYRDRAGVDSDIDVRATAAARLWRTGERENRLAAEAIWKEIKYPKDIIEQMKRETSFPR